MDSLIKKLKIIQEKIDSSSNSSLINRISDFFGKIYENSKGGHSNINFGIIWVHHNI